MCLHLMIVEPELSDSFLWKKLKFRGGTGVSRYFSIVDVVQKEEEALLSYKYSILQDYWLPMLDFVELFYPETSMRGAVLKEMVAHHNRYEHRGWSK